MQHAFRVSLESIFAFTDLSVNMQDQKVKCCSINPSRPVYAAGNMSLIVKYFMRCVAGSTSNGEGGSPETNGDRQPEVRGWEVALVSNANSNGGATTSQLVTPTLHNSSNLYRTISILYMEQLINFT